jgi:hypothetical protein
VSFHRRFKDATRADVTRTSTRGSVHAAESARDEESTALLWVLGSFILKKIERNRPQNNVEQVPLANDVA